MNQISSFLSRLPGQVYLWVAVIIFGASNSVTQQLTEIGSQRAMIEGSNPISYCNVLFVGNICALLVLILIYRRQLNFHQLMQLSGKDLLTLIAVAIASGALAPGLTFQALALTMVNNVILIGRVEPPLVLALSVWLLGERVNIWQVAGAIVSLVGVALTILLQPPEQNMVNMGGLFSLGTGEFLTAGAAVALAVSTIISKRGLPRIPLGIYTVFRTSLGTVIFFFAALYFYGSNHFMEVFSPFLWQWMLIYGIVIVAMGQLSWFTGLKSSSVSEASLVSSFNPIAGIAAAFLILGEVPTSAQYIGGGIIIAGIILSQIGIRRKMSRDTQLRESSDNQMEMNKEMQTGVGYKGF